jgi:hypothetical protein
MVRRVALIASVLAAAAYGCGSSDDNPVAVPGDDASDGNDGLAPAPPPPPAPPGDGGTDSGRDAASDAEGGPPFCSALSPAPKFCADFDDADPTSHWDQVTVLGGISTLAIDTTISTSSPASLFASMAARPSGESGVGHLRKTVAGTPTRAKLVFSAHPSETVFTKGAYSIVDLDVTINHIFTLYLYDDDDVGGHKPSLKEISGGTITYHPLPKVPPANAWTRITLDIDSANGKATLLYGAEKILDAITVGTDATMQDPTFRIGTVYVFGPSDPWTVNFDDVLFDF